MSSFAGRAPDMLLERLELLAPEGLDLGDPARELVEGLSAQAVDPEPRVLLVALLVDEPAFAQHPQVPTHGGGAHLEGRRELPRGPGTAPQQVDDAASRRVGEGSQRIVEGRRVFLLNGNN